MSSDDHANDRGRQAIESVEDSGDVEMGGLGSSEDEVLQGATHWTASSGQRAVRSDQVSESGTGSDEDGDSEDEAEPTEGALGSRHNTGLQAESGTGRRDAAAVGSEARHVALDDGDDPQHDRPDRHLHFPPGQEPPSYQVSSGGSQYSPDDTVSTASAASQGDEDTMSADNNRRNQKSRKRKSPRESSHLRSGDEGLVDARPTKKIKGSFNRAYLDLLNHEIEHAASQYIPRDNLQFDERIGLPASQIGLTMWSPMEKERFFEALGRLGRDNTAGISERIRSKGEMEVRQYMKLLQDGLAHRQQHNEIAQLELTDIPAAVELSADCCRALEEAADNIALKQEHSEEAIEKSKQENEWLVSQEYCQTHAEDDPEDDSLVAVNIFNMPNWLALSERFFMNAPSAEGNWYSVAGDTPSVRLTTLEDFRSLAFTLTRRLVAASIFMAKSRIRSERRDKPDTKDIVKPKDVDAATKSLGLATQKPPFLVKFARRLGLLIYQDPPKPNEEQGEDPIPYDAVEVGAAADRHHNIGRIRMQLKGIALSSDEDSVSSDSTAESGAETGYSGQASSDGEDGEDEEEVRAEADEAILYSAVDPPQTKRDREALLRRVRAERAQERHADAVDLQTSFQEEVRMWDLLGRKHPDGLRDPGCPERKRKIKFTADAGHAVGHDWRAKTRAISEWESRYQSLQRKI